MRDKVALITGAGSGIGRSTALRLARRGCRVACGDLNATAAEQVAAEARQAGAEAIAVGLDVTAKASVQAFVDGAVKEYGRVDFLVNCAGIWEVKPLIEIDEATWERMLNVNLKGPFLCAQAAVCHMLQARSGCIVNVASIAGRMGGNLCGAHYAASKGGVIALTMHMARELGPKGIRVNGVAPGITETPMTAAWPEEVMAGVVSRTPLGRLGQADDIADAIVFLLSDDARFIAGETIEVNGGLLTH
jgi:NAD(P)-dependent dehydrogenase (short-subunit alcohol dehydrogenase family)